MYMYMYMYWRFRGASPACLTPLDREIDFNFDFDSFVRGEANLRERVRRASLSLGLPVGSCAARWLSRGGFWSNSCCYTRGL